MIYIGNIRELNKMLGIRLMIVRSLKREIPGVIQIADLSPSPYLFREYLSLKKNGKWNMESFKSFYVPVFLKEIKENKMAKSMLNKIYHLDKQGVDISLICFCPEEAMCHRSIVAGLLQGAGANVSCNTDYSYYYSQYKTI